MNQLYYQTLKNGTNNEGCSSAGRANGNVNHPRAITRNSKIHEATEIVFLGFMRFEVDQLKQLYFDQPFLHYTAIYLPARSVFLRPWWFQENKRHQSISLF